MSDNIDPYQGSPMLVPIPYKMWKELEEVMQHNDITRGQDVGTFAAIICQGAIADYIESVSDVEKKKKGKKDATN